MNFSKPINFVVHGWHDGMKGGDMFNRNLSKSNGLWMEPLAKDWARYNNTNVCIVDWSFLAQGDYFHTINTQLKRVVTAFVNFMEILRGYGMDYRQVSIAGHSLGAHIAGMVGEAIKSKGWEIYAIYGMCNKSKNLKFFRRKYKNYMYTP